MRVDWKPWGTVLAFAACAACGSKSATVDSTQGASIVNGTAVEDGDPVLKSTVGLAMKMRVGQGSCTGTLLSDKVLLTAAHCVDGDLEKVAVIFARDFEQATRETVRRGLKVMLHPLWGQSDSSGRGDLALVLFKDAPPEGFGPAVFFPEDESLTEGEEVIVTGFGVSDGIQREGSGVLRRTTMKVLGLFSPTEVVTDGRERSVCFGDSGGPSYVFRSGNLYLWGVASAVSNPSCTEYAIHTDVARYLSWIQEQLASLTAEAPVLEAAFDPSAPIARGGAEH